jgi:hypothetical protein
MHYTDEDITSFYKNLDEMMVSGLKQINKLGFNSKFGVEERVLEEENRKIFYIF